VSGGRIVGLSVALVPAICGILLGLGWIAYRLHLHFTEGEGDDA
jgi:hypothetical protein